MNNTSDNIYYLQRLINSPPQQYGLSVHTAWTTNTAVLLSISIYHSNNCPEELTDTIPYAKRLNLTNGHKCIQSSSSHVLVSVA